MKKMVKVFSSVFCTICFLIIPQLVHAETYTDEYGNTYTYEINGYSPMYGELVSITDFNGSGDVIIPEKLGGRTVGAISGNAFENCTSIKRLEMPNTISAIGVCAFGGCEALTDITLPKGITKISSFTFLQCYKLTNITIPEGVALIDEQAFYDCRELKSIKLPKSLTSVSAGAFVDCKSLKTIEYSGSSAEWNKISIGLGNDYLVNADVKCIVDECSHNFSEWETEEEPTCLDEGCQRKTCTLCGYYVIEDIKALGHDKENGTWNRVSNPNCYMDGLEELTCARCMKVVESKNIPATNEHIYDFYIVPSTCTEQGYTYYYCMEYGCSAYYETDYTEKTGHSMDEWSVRDYMEQPTCTEYGIERRMCQVCYVEEERYVEPLGHDMDSCFWQECELAGCKTDGKEGLYCNRCNNYIEYRPIPATGHYYESDVKHPTCTESGYTRYYCWKCGDNYIDDVIEAPGHQFGEGEIITEPTCTEKGLIRRYCQTDIMYSFCEEYIEEEIDEKGHDYVNAYWETVDYTSDCIYMSLKCPACGEEIDSKVIQIIASGECGDNLTWILEQNGSLTITGTGQMYSWSEESQTPWYNYRDSIKKIIIQDGITTIGDYAFVDCGELITLEMGKDISIIGDCAFWGCEQLEAVELGDLVTKIGIAAFEYCNSINDIFVPENVVEIGERAFSDCYYLTSITVDENNRNYSSADGHLFNKDKTTIIQHASYPDSNFYAIPYSVTTIGNYAFCGNFRLDEVVIPNSVTHIGDGAFAYSGLDEIFLPDSIKGIGNGAFKGLDIKAVIIPDSVVDFGEGVFRDCHYLESVKLGKGIREVSPYAFYRCSNLYDITFGENITLIDRYAFGDCSSLINLEIPNGVTIIGERAFDSCGSLEHVIFGDDVKHIGEAAFKFCFALKKVTFGNCLEYIGAEAFYSCEELERATLPGSLLEIKSSVFDACDNLKAVYYLGTKSAWEKVSVSKNNEILNNAIVFVPTSCTITERNEENNSFVINVFHTDTGKNVVLALYNRGILVEIQSAIYEGDEILFTATKPYTDAKVMVWDDFEHLKPVYASEDVN